MRTVADPGLLRLITTGASLLLSASLACAQIPGLSKTAPPKAETSAKAAPQESPEQARARVSKLLDEVREEAERPPEPVPPGITQSEVADLRDLHVKLTAAYDIQLRSLGQIEQAAEARKAAEARARDWTGFEASPPYSIVRVDELRSAAIEASSRIRLYEAGLVQIKIESQRVQEVLRFAEQDLHRAVETFDAASTPDQKATAAWRRKLASVRVRAAAAGTTAAGILAKFRSDNLAAYRAELELLERQIAIASRDVSFTETDLTAARKLIDDKIASARRELAAVEAQMGPRLKERDAAAKNLASAQAGADTNPDDRASAEARLTAANAWIDARRDQTNALRGLVILGEEYSTLWSARYSALHGTDADARRIAQVRLHETLGQVTGRKLYSESLVREARSSLAQIEARLASGSVPPTAVRYEQDALAAQREAVLATERLQNEIETASRQVAGWVADLDAARERRDFRARLGDSWLALRDSVHNVWNFELFAVEDTAVSDGQTVTFSRGVTVGKSVGAVLFFVLGLLAMVALARGIERRLVQRGVDAAGVRTGKRWILALSAVLLLLLTLNIAKIPVTVFAFLGGALAIGAGFGIQTLIKNLSSGVVMMMERQIKVGDVVEVEGIAGTITEVNLRSSTVLAADGTESIIPNSVFVENKVTNWTGSNRKVRRVVKVGVAYGSPVREVADLLDECAKRHGLVLGDPAPVVIFEDFGDSALIFALYFWLELRPNTSSVQVMSDLRFMIEKRFAEAGISIAYPQRDLNLRAERPLRVDLVRQPRPDRTEPPDQPA